MTHTAAARSQIGRLLLVAALALVLPGCSYNRFTTSEESIKGSWSEVENQLQRRNDLIEQPG